MTTFKSSSEYHVGFSTKGVDEVDGKDDGEGGGENFSEDDGDGNNEVPVPTHTNSYHSNPYQPLPTLTPLGAPHFRRKLKNLKFSSNKGYIRFRFSWK